MVMASYMIKLVVLSVLACQVHAREPGWSHGILGPFWYQESPVRFNNFNLEAGYGPFSENAHNVVARSAKRISNNSSILLNQTGPSALPPFWYLQGLCFCEDDPTVLAFRLDNLDMIGFMNKTGHWNSFQGVEHLIPGSRGLGFRNDYESLIGGQLTAVHVEGSSILEAQRIVFNYDPNTSPEEEFKVSLAQLRIITSEALRFTRINQQINLGWESEENFIGAEDARHVLMWREISEAVLSWKQTGSWDGEHVRSLSAVGIHDEEDAMSLVRLVSGPPPES
ncbi:hypothetical protein QOZ80_3AG0223210 [Eleusine coracana subsp. coracana]|nr:hypothetical protein QOZ80_3AG0223210 [Eleusine coracana subsp. coracana]